MTCVECNGTGYAGGVVYVDRTPDPCPRGCKPVVLAAPMYVGLFQAGPALWTAEVTICGCLRYVSSHYQTRREAFLAAIEWAEQQAVAA